MTGRQAEQKIHEQAWTGRTPGLERIRALLGRLGDPQRELKFVHITGTNGKGSTAAMVASVLSRAGVRTGLYTSPHLWDFRERFQVDGVLIPDEDLGRITETVLRAARNMEDAANEFELMTAVAMVWFRERQCGLVVLEVGLGGRLDPTNVIPAPEAAVITNLGLEHTALLGDTLPLIAKEKAGIIKAGSRAVLYHQSEEVEAVVSEVCRSLGVPLTITASDTLEVERTGRSGQVFRYRGKEYRISQLGRYQIDNAAAAIETVEALRLRGWEISETALREGLLAARWPGRMELVRRNPDVLLDGGHNPQCVEAIARSLRELYPGKKVYFLMGVLSDKDYREMLRLLIPLADCFFTLTPDSPRALSAQDLADYLCAQGAEARPCGGAGEGLEAALERAGQEGVVCACGSLYLVGELRHILHLC